MQLLWADGRPVDTPRTTDPVAWNERSRRPVGGRPWVSVSMVAGLDGSVVIDGRSGALSSPVDQQCFQAARAACDTALAGAETVRAEGYGAASKPGHRVGVITRSGRLDYGTPLWTSGTGYVVAPAVAEVPDEIDVVRAGDDSIDFPAALAGLPGVLGPIESVHLDGGPGVLSIALEADVVDELNVTTSPHVTLGDGPRLASGWTERLRRYDLEQMAVDDGYVFTRWIRRR